MPLFGGFAQARNFGKGGAGRPPGFVTASGSSLGTLRGGSGSSGLLSAAATTGPGDPPITGYSIISGSLPPGLNFNTTTGAITGSPTIVSSSTTSTFIVQASSPSGNVQATFSITIRVAITATWTSVQNTNWSVPVGVTEVEILMVAPGGSGGHIGGGGGAGGIVFTTSYPVTPGGSIPINITSPGGRYYGSYPRGNSGGDSTFGTLTAKGGGYGGGYSPTTAGGPGGSGGGGAHNSSYAGGTSNQPTANPGVGGLTNYGNNGGHGHYPVTHQGAGGGGAAGTGTSWQQGYPHGGSGAYFSEYTSYGTPGGHFAAGGGGGGWSGHIYGRGNGGTGGGGYGGYNGAGQDASGHGSGGGSGGHPAPVGTVGSPGAIFIKY